MTQLLRHHMHALAAAHEKSCRLQCCDHITTLLKLLGCPPLWFPRRYYHWIGQLLLKPTRDSCGSTSAIANCKRHALLRTSPCTALAPHTPAPPLPLIPSAPFPRPKKRLGITSLGPCVPHEDLSSSLSTNPFSPLPIASEIPGIAFSTL